MDYALLKNYWNLIRLAMRNESVIDEGVIMKNHKF